MSGSHGNGAVDRIGGRDVLRSWWGRTTTWKMHPNETRAVERYHHTLEQFQAYEG